MGENGTGIGRETVIFAAAFWLGMLVAEQQHKQEAARLREAVKNANARTMHLMSMSRTRHDQS